MSILVVTQPFLRGAAWTMSPGTIRGAVTGGVLSVIAGGVLAYQASLEGARLQASPDAPHPWLHAIAVNALIVAVFVVPLATIFGRWIDRARKPKHSERE